MPSKNKITVMEIYILVLGNIILPLLLFASFNLEAYHVCSELNCLMLTPAARIAPYVFLGAMFLSFPWFMISLINFIKHKKDQPTRATTLFAAPAFTLLQILLPFIIFNEMIPSKLFAALTTVAIVATDIVFYLFYRSQRKQSN